MSKVKKTKNDDDGFDDLDFDDLDDIDFDSEGEFGDDGGDNREPKLGGLAKEFATGARDSFLGDLVKKTAEDSLPEGFTSDFRDGLDYVDFTKDVFVDSKNKINKSLARTAKEVKKLLPFNIGFLDKFVEENEEESSAFKAKSEEAVRTESIAGNLDAIFNKQLDFQKIIQAKTDAENQVKDRQELVTNKLNVDILSSIENNISNQTAFTLQIAKEYYKKSLELQFKSYFIQADMLKTMKDYYKGFSVQFDIIGKNSGLPEFVKIRGTERLQEVLRTQIVQDIYSKNFSNSNYIAGVKKRITGVVNEKVSSVTEPLDNLGEMLGAINDTGEDFGGSGKLLSGIFGSLAGSTLGEKLGSKISPKIKESIKDNRGINTAANYLGTLAGSPETFFKDARKQVNDLNTKFEEGNGPGSFLGSKITGFLNDILEVTTPEKIKATLTDTSILSHGQPAIFDINTHRSITEVIPMFLGKILHENTTLKDMYNKVNLGKLKTFNPKDELIYDFTKRKLNTKDTVTANIQADLFKTSQSREIKELSLRTLTSLSGSSSKFKNLKTEANRKVLEDYFVQAKDLKNTDFTYDSLVNKSESNPELKKIIDNNPQLKELIDNLKLADRDITDKKERKDFTKIKDSLDSSFSNVKNLYPIGTIKEVFSAIGSLVVVTFKLRLSDKQAESIARAMTNYTIKRGLIDADSITSLKLFNAFLTDDELGDEKLAKLVTAFSSQVKAVSEGEDQLKKSNLSLILGLLNNAIKKNINYNSAVFQSIRDYNNELVEKELGASQLVEGILGEGKEDENKIINGNKLAPLRGVRQTLRVNDEVGKEGLVDLLVNSKAGKKFIEIKSTLIDYKEAIKTERATLKKELEDAGTDPKKIADALTKSIGKFSNAVSGVTAELYGKATSNLDKLSKLVTIEITEKFNEKANEIVGNIDNASKYLEEIMSREEAAFQDKITILIDSKQSVNNEEAIDRAINFQRKLHEAKIKTLKSSVSQLNKLKETIASVRNSTVEGNKSAVNNGILKIKVTFVKAVENIQTNIEEFKRQLAETEAEGTPLINPGVIPPAATPQPVTV